LATLLLLARTNIEGNLLEPLWAAHFVDRRVKQALLEMLESRDQGLVRLIHRKVPEQSMADVFTTLWGLAPVNTDGDPPKPLDLPLVDEARPVWVDFVNTHGQETADVSSPLAAAFSELEGYAARLALVLSLARWAENPGALGIGPDAVDLESIRAGIEIVEWAKNETRRIYATLSEDDEEREQREVLELVERRGGIVTVREMQQTMHFKTAEDADAILAALVADGLGRWIEKPAGPRGGRPTRYFQLHRPDPAETGVSCYETPLNLKECEVW
jgi:hypothetical protein